MEALIIEARELFGWWIHSDDDQTTEFYRQGFALCDCIYCRNFAAAAGHIPAAMRAALQSLGVNPDTPYEVMIPVLLSSDERLEYMALYPVVGELVAAALPSQFAGADYDFWIEPGGSAPIPSDFPDPAVQVVISVWLPWLIPDELGELPERETVAELVQQQRKARLARDASARETSVEQELVAQQRKAGRPGWWRRLSDWLARS